MIGESINGSTAGQLRCRFPRHQLDWSPWLDQELRPTSDRQVRMRAFININCDLYQEHGEVIHGARGSTSTLPLGDRAVFPNSKLVFAATTSLSVALMIPLVELCGIKSTTTMQNFIEFRWRNLRQSTIYRSPVKSGQEFGRVSGMVFGF